MKFYSEKLEQLFDTEEELKAAEGKKKRKSCASTCKSSCTACEDACKESCTEKAQAVEKQPSRKVLSANIDAAETKVAEAHNAYNEAKAKISELSKKYIEDVAAIENEARKVVEEAEAARAEAIQEFNKYYGTYSAFYTGDRAEQELQRALNSMNTIADKMWASFWGI